MMKTAFARLAAITAVPLLASVCFAGVAGAHVRVDGQDVAQGGYGVLTFRVPTESDTASTTGLTVTLPDDTPIISVSTQPKAGWTATLVKKNLTTPEKDDDGNEISQYISQVVWQSTTPAAAIPPGAFDTFAISVGPLPKAASVSLPALQTYSDGTTVNWNEKTAEGQAEPEHPAPELTLAAAKSDSAEGAASTTTAAGSDTDNGPTWPGIAGLAVAIVALLVGIAGFAVNRRTS